MLWGADIKPAFLSGDASSRRLAFRPPQEVREFRLGRELVLAGLGASQLDPLVFLLREATSNELLGACGVRIDDLLGGGSAVMDMSLQQLRSKLPFRDFRAPSIKHTGTEIRQGNDFSCGAPAIPASRGL